MRAMAATSPPPTSRKAHSVGSAVLWHDSVDFTRDRRGRVQAMLGMAGVLRSGVPNPRFAYMPINPANLYPYYNDMWLEA